MFYRRMFPIDLLSELNRLQRSFEPSSDFSPSIRGFSGSGFPALNVGSTPQSVEVFAFLPGVNPTSIEVNLEKGVLAVAGERRVEPPAQDDKTNVHIDERFSGRFRRVVTLPDDIDPNAVHARCRDGVLHVSIQRRTAAQSRRISIQ